MQFQVPQFIEVEDKIFGPLTFKQFLYIGGALGASYIWYRLFSLIYGAPLIIGTLGMGFALAFFTLNGRPFIFTLESAFYYITRSKLYLWNNTIKKSTPTITSAEPSRDTGGLYVPKLSDSKLHDLAWSLDIQERIAAGIAGNDQAATRRPFNVRTLRDELRNS